MNKAIVPNSFVFTKIDCERQYMQEIYKKALIVHTFLVFTGNLGHLC